MSDSDADNIPSAWAGVMAKSSSPSTSEAESVPLGWAGVVPGNEPSLSEDDIFGDLLDPTEHMEAAAPPHDVDSADVELFAVVEQPPASSEPAAPPWKKAQRILVDRLLQKGPMPALEDGVVDEPADSAADDGDESTGGLADPEGGALAFLPAPVFARPGPRPASSDAELLPSCFSDIEFYDVLSACGVCLHKCPGLKEHDRQDPENQKIVRHCLVTGGLTLSLKAEAALQSVDPNKLRAMQAELAMAAILCQRHHAVDIGRAIVLALQQQSEQLINYIEFARYDETPLKFRAASGAWVSLEQAARDAKLPGLLAPRVVEEDALPGKMNNSETSVALLFRQNDTYFCLEIRFVHWLQTMMSTNGECYYRATQQGRLPMHEVAQAFTHRQRITATDQDGAIERCEATIQAKDPELHSLRAKCEVHKAAGHRKKVMKLFGPAISFLLHTSLAIGFGAAISVMREELRDVFRDSVVYKVGAPPPECRRQLDALLKVFANIDIPKAKLRATIIGILFNGSIYGDQIVHYCQGCCRDAADCLLKFQVYGVQALCGACPTPFPQHRWTRQEESVNFVGLFEGLNRLFSRTFKRFCYRVGVRVPRPQHAGQWGQQMMAIEAAVQEDQSREQEQGDPESVAKSLGQSTWQQKQVQQSNSRKIVLSMTDLEGDGPLAEVVVLANVVEPFRKFMAALLFLGGEQWQRDHEAALANKLLQGQPGELRPYRGLVAATCKVEDDISELVRLRMTDASFWESVPVRSRTVRLRANAFKSLGMLLGLLALSKTEHQGYPFKIFLLLLRPQDAALIAEIQMDEHLWDAWSRGFVLTWLAKGLTCTDALMDIRAALSLAVFDTAGLEAKHSAIRRVLKALSNQARTPSLATVSALEVLRLFRKYAGSVQKVLRSDGGGEEGEARGEADEQDQDDAGPPTKKGRRGGGGAWRKYCADKRGPGQRADFSALAVAYKNIDKESEEWSDLVKGGQSATRRHRQGVACTHSPT